MKKLRQATICLLIKDDQVLLALKKRGFGEGKWNGVGGKVKDGETIEQTAIRETQEEIGVTPVRMERDDQMWSDDIFWMPKVFAGQKVKAEFIFSGEGKLKEYKFGELV